ncbi:MAG TPA: hypothetical protein EYQ85_05185 [Candidatus Poseidoniales archaeon]|nr:hypothetical protein [Candidatus Poseidoniales archaeon]
MKLCKQSKREQHPLRHMHPFQQRVYWGSVWEERSHLKQSLTSDIVEKLSHYAGILHDVLYAFGCGPWYEIDDCAIDIHDNMSIKNDNERFAAHSEIYRQWGDRINHPIEHGKWMEYWFLQDSYKLDSKLFLPRDNKISIVIDKNGLVAIQ